MRFPFLFFLILASYSLMAQTPRSYAAYKTLSEIVIDGRADEEDWIDTRWTEEFTDIEGDKKTKFSTRVKMLWDEDYFYIYARMEEPHIWATLKQRDTVIFYNNDFEVFLDPDGDSQKYMELEMNALNTVWDLMLVEAYREGGHAVDSWNINGLKTGVNIKGSLNNPEDEDIFWEVEIAMPWEVLTEASETGEIPVNDFWRVNFSRVNWDHSLKNNRYFRKQDENGNYLPEYNWVWSPQGVINMHEPEHWGYVYFSDVPPSEEIVFEIPKDEAIRWKMYELYRAQKSYFKRDGEWATSVAELTGLPIWVEGKRVEFQIEKHSAGYNIIVESPFSGNKYLIKENGDFMDITKTKEIVND
ncbi:carbohydrate-binding family 9-like protein [Autumnicola musiva]|uniref:Carbohydrate-binding family 9-like protein n=1 Tax=Autumnicola musiva TaxID=3075589 RepID=A0ABU3D310_9FLAO|nr:carbohydrate-binding family 9-like protein [Zunongwangia sp. F117]MDT0675879.1 carbohydrate-binding family 9-like protein [Zunongwangia sp. F117]